MNGQLKQHGTTLRNIARSVCLFSVLSMVIATTSPAQTFTIVKRFNGYNGGEPEATPVEGLDGNLYGTTGDGGATYSATSSGYGTVYKFNPAGKLVTIHSFCTAAPCADGAGPLAGLALGTDGRFYGTTSALGPNGDGTIFAITAKGALTTVYSPGALNGLVEGSDGYFYGTTNFTVFKTADAGGAFFATLYNFCASPGCLDGASPSGLIQGTDGNFYGTTVSGGAYNQGTVFRISPAGTLTTLHTFCATSFSGSCQDGGSPERGVVEGTDGNFYGTTTFGGVAANCTGGCGTIFKITPQGTLTTLFDFTFPSNQGNQPYGPLVQGTDGNFYGTTSGGGASNHGVIFQITTGGALTVVHNFAASDGNPLAGLMQKTDGNFYGTAPGSPNGNSGNIFRLSMGLGPFVKTLPAAACTGCGVDIVGPNLTGTTSVTFNGAPAKFVVLSATLINCTVPTGATTGPVQVTTPSSILTSNVSFQVLP